jgi:hypothetical protein
MKIINADMSLKYVLFHAENAVTFTVTPSRTSIGLSVTKGPLHVLSITKSIDVTKLKNSSFWSIPTPLIHMNLRLDIKIINADIVPKALPVAIMVMHIALSMLMHVIIRKVVQFCRGFDRDTVTEEECGKFLQVYRCRILDEEEQYNVRWPRVDGTELFLDELQQTPGRIGL